MIRARGVSFAYPGRPAALTDVDVDLPSNGRAWLVGASGSGKSTLALCLAGLLRPRAGRIEVDGLPAGGARRSIAWRLGLLFQAPASQLLTRRVADEVALPLENLGWARPDIVRRTAEVLDGLGLAALAERDPHALSGGEMQRVALAAALAPTPRYLFLDEPFAHLDGDTASEVAGWLDRAARERGCLRLDIAPLPPAGADAEARLLVLERGRVVHDGPALPPPLADRLAGADLGAFADDWSPLPAARGLRAAGVAIRAGDRVLAADLEIEAAAGSVTTLSGPSGSGKSTLLMTLAGLIEPAAGSIQVGGPLRERVAYVPQFPERLFWRRTVGEELRSFDPGDAGRRGVAAPGDPATDLARVGLPPAVAAVSPFRLSGGERRRLALACGLRSRRPVLLLDEPAAGMDGPGRRLLERLVRGVATAGGAVVLVAHAPDLIALGDTRLSLRRGRLEPC